MQAVELLRQRIPIAEAAFASVVVWQVPHPVPPSTHDFKYRLAYVVRGVCVVRYDNERGKGDHRHPDDVGTAMRKRRIPSPESSDCCQISMPTF